MEWIFHILREYVIYGFLIIRGVFTMHHTEHHQTSCECNTATPHIKMGNTPSSYSIPLSQLDNAKEKVNTLLSKKLKKSKALLEDSTLHCFEKGFGLGSWAISEKKLTFAAYGNLDKIPSLVALEFDTSFFDSASKGKNQNIFWIDVDIIQPIPRKLKIPLRGVGVLRDPSSGNLLRCENFELATELVADVKDIAKIIACVLGCVGLFCAAFCAPLCVAIIACVACLGTCVGANLPQFLVCVTACGIALDGLEDVLT